MKQKLVTRSLYIVSAIAVLAASLLAAIPKRASAAPLTNSYVRFDRMKASTATPVRAVFTVPSGNSQTEASFKLNFPDAYTVNTSQTVSVANCPTEASATALPGTLSATGSNANGSKAITITGVTNLSAGATYCVDFTGASAVTNPAAGQYVVYMETRTSGSALIDSANQAARVIADDQIVISAVVPPTFSFTLSGNTDAFVSNLDTASVVSTGGRTVTIATNGPFGWLSWVKDSNAGLTSATASKTINTSGSVDGSPTTLSAGAEGYVLDVDLTTDASGGCTVAIAGEYNGTTTSAGGTLSNSTYQQTSSCSGGTSNNDVITLIERATISAATPAGNDYTDTMTVIGAASF